ncbi:MAG: xanthine dehydrogenase family protein subunit M [Deltaproteobacteria bacterium]|nr:MAG: xanthine dehydrogenase family protein subunit M [Deltaproteobacteria bacterium]
MDYFEPKTITEALSVLAKYGEHANVIAGGTDVMVDMKYKEEPGCLVNIKKIPGLDTIQENGASLQMGPLVTIRDIETSRLVRERLPLLWESCHQFASLQIRNTATIGGNICRASPSGETLAPLLALEAKAKLAFRDGEKTEAFISFFQGPGKTSLGSKGLLTEIEIPYPPKGSHGVYLKHAVRGAMDIAMVGVAVLITADAGNSSLQDVRIALGAVAPTPIRATKTEALLRGRSLTAALVKEAATLAASESSPITDQRSSAEYRGWIVEALTRRGLEQSWKAASGKEVV